MLMRGLIFGILIMLLLPGMAAGISKYVDENGRLVFVDDESKIPAKHLKKAESLENIAEPTDQEKTEQAERLRQERDARQGEQIQEREKRKAEQWKKPYETPVEILGTQILIPAQLAFGSNELEVILSLDTSLEKTVLYRRRLTALAVDFAEGETGSGDSTGDEKFHVRKIVLKALTVGPFKGYNVPVLVSEDYGSRVNYDGALGMDFLAHLSYEVDYVQQVIRWQP